MGVGGVGLVWGGGAGALGTGAGQLPSCRAKGPSVTREGRWLAPTGPVPGVALAAYSPRGRLRVERRGLRGPWRQPHSLRQAAPPQDEAGGGGGCPFPPPPRLPRPAVRADLGPRKQAAESSAAPPPQVPPAPPPSLPLLFSFRWRRSCLLPCASQKRGGAGAGSACRRSQCRGCGCFPTVSPAQASPRGAVASSLGPSHVGEDAGVAGDTGWTAGPEGGPEGRRARPSRLPWRAGQAVRTGWGGGGAATGGVAPCPKPTPVCAPRPCRRPLPASSARTAPLGPVRCGGRGGRAPAGVGPSKGSGPPTARSRGRGREAPSRTPGDPRPRSRRPFSCPQRRVGARGRRQQSPVAGGQPHPAVGPAGELPPGRGEYRGASPAWAASRVDFG